MTSTDKNNEVYLETTNFDGGGKKTDMSQINHAANHSLKYAIMTTFSSRGYEQYARRMLETYDRHLPREVDIYAYYEGEVPDFQSQRIYYRNLEKLSPDLVWFKKECDKDPLKCGQTAKGYNLQHDARRFAHKSFCVFHCTQNTDADIVYWFDADSVAFQDVPMSFVQNLLLPEYYTSYLGRKHIGLYSECGFVGYNLKHPTHKEFMTAWHQLYMFGDLFKLPQWHDCTSYDSVREKLEKEGKIKSNNLSQHIQHSHAFVNSILGDYFDHLKGPVRKQKGKSLPKDIVGKSSVEYWNSTQKSTIKSDTSKEKQNLQSSQESVTKIYWKPLENPSLNRYTQVIDCINLFKPGSIIEVGTWSGDRALEMVKAALKYQEKVHYIGFDLFEDATKETDAVELNVKRHNTVAEISARLKEFQNNNPGFTFELVKGNTRETLKQPRIADFAFIDGGHSVDTIRNDYEGLKDCPVILFDDYYVSDSKGRCPDLTKFGCNEIVKNLPHYILPMTGNIAGGGLTAMALKIGEISNKASNLETFKSSKKLAKLDRYTQVINSINLFKPTSIIEVGTWKGVRALEMVKTALKHRKKVHYIGFDLFEDATKETDAVELNVKRHNTVTEVSARLKEFQNTNPGFTFELVKGNTRETLKQLRVADFAFIDGGHSIETIRNDYEGLKNCPVILFDDYYVADSQGKCPELEKFGCNNLVDNLPHKVLPIMGPIAGGGLTAMAVVMGIKMTAEIRPSVPKLNPYVASSNGKYGVFEGNTKDKAIFSHYSQFRVWAPEIQYLLIKKLFSPEDDGTYLDIGANIGLTVIPLAERRGKVNCYAFEPEPENYQFLLKNIIRHQVPLSVQSYPVALFSHQTQVDFELSPNNTGDHRVRIENTDFLVSAVKGENSRKVIRVQAEPLDNIFSAKNIQKLKKPIVMKLDIQGSELQFCHGSSVFLQSVDHLIVKFWPYGLRRLGDTPEELMNTLIKNFSFGAILKKYKGDEPQINIQKDLNNLCLEPIEKVFTDLQNRLHFDDVKFTGYLNVVLSKHPDLVSYTNNINLLSSETEKLDLIH
ncbi:class I SAM-dependent methyltransferase [Dapis sp. BLCC M126]|uniref:class I SAM-dependent methyltransferase n=1 Tax=Dapis sp. BLCC M126 TaxID=3400189 RepID=UPI003CF286ED